MKPDLLIAIGGITFGSGFISVILSIVIMRFKKKRLYLILDKEYGE